MTEYEFAAHEIARLRELLQKARPGSVMHSICQRDLEWFEIHYPSLAKLYKPN